MKAQWIVPAVALLAATPLLAQTPGSSARGQRIDVVVPRTNVTSDSIRLILAGRPRLGVTVVLRPNQSDSIGATIMSVTPGGPAAKAGIRSGDVITRLDGKSVLGSRNDSPDRIPSEGQSLPGLRLIELAAKLAPNDTIPVELRRGNDRRTVRLVTEPEEGVDSWSSFNAPARTIWGHQLDSPQSVFRVSPDNELFRLQELNQMGPAAGRMRVFFGSALSDLELAPLNDDLGSYFGTTDGVLVVSVPTDSKLNLKGGDVILSVDGRKPSGPAHLMRILQSYDRGETFRMEVMRNHHRDTISGSLGDAHR